MEHAACRSGIHGNHGPLGIRGYYAVNKMKVKIVDAEDPGRPPRECQEIQAWKLGEARALDCPVSEVSSVELRYQARLRYRIHGFYPPLLMIRRAFCQKPRRSSTGNLSSCFGSVPVMRLSVRLTTSTLLSKQPWVGLMVTLERLSGVSDR